MEIRKSTVVVSASAQCCGIFSFSATGADRLSSVTAAMMAPKPRMKTSASCQTAAANAMTRRTIRTLPRKLGSVWR